MGYFLFLLVTATLFIRPAEIIPAVHAWPIYEWLILACLAVSFPQVLPKLTPESLVENPITACVVGLLVAVVLSHLSHLFIWGARMSGFMFLKLVIYYLLLVTLVDTPERLHSLLFWLVIFSLVVTVLAVLQYQELINIPSLAALDRRVFDPETESYYTIRQMRSTGIFNDPNDLCLILVVAAAISLYFAGDQRYGPFRFAWLGLVGLFGYALAMTQSRGGFLAFLGAVLAFLYLRFGWKKAVPLAALALPVMFVLFAGRQTDIGSAIAEDTGQSRIQLWSEGLGLFKNAPVFGIGQGFYVEETSVHQVAHNSFVHAFTELGFFGGMLFLGAFYCAVWPTFRLAWSDVEIHDPELARMRPYITAILVGYAVGMLSLSRNYIVPTYMILGLAAVYLSLAASTAPLPATRLDSRMLGRMAALSVCFIAAVYVFVRVFARWGS